MPESLPQVTYLEDAALAAEIEMVAKAAIAARASFSRKDDPARIVDYLTDVAKWSRIAIDTCSKNSNISEFAKSYKKQE